MVEGLEMTCFQIISNVGAARSSYIEGIQKAKAGDFDGARKCIEEGQKLFLVGHEAHFELIQKEAPVSYTHLDVYKRQDNGQRAGAQGLCQSHGCQGIDGLTGLGDYDHQCAFIYKGILISKF